MIYTSEQREQDSMNRKKTSPSFHQFSFDTSFDQEKWNWQINMFIFNFRINIFHCIQIIYNRFKLTTIAYNTPHWFNQFLKTISKWMSLRIDVLQEEFVPIKDLVHCITQMS
jgi:hypothetical protein